MTSKDGRFCDRCGKPLTRSNNKSGYEICDSCNEILDKQVKAEKEYRNFVSVIEDIKAEIKKNILDKPVENGTNAEMACYNGGLLKGLEIIDKHISGKENTNDKNG